MNASMDIFKVDQIKPFLSCKLDPISKNIVLHGITPIIYSQIKFDELFVNEVPKDKIEAAFSTLGGTLYEAHIVHIMATEIAFKTRRAAGNIIFASNKTYEDIFTRSEEVSKIINARFKTTIDDQIPDKEIRITYWKPILSGEYDPNPNEVKGIDGGIQVYDGKICLNDNYENYFMKAILL